LLSTCHIPVPQHLKHGWFAKESGIQNNPTTRQSVIIKTVMFEPNLLLVIYIPLLFISKATQSRFIFAPVFADFDPEVQINLFT